MSVLKGKHIIIGITGSIAAYKSCLLIRQFIKAGAEVQVIITPSGKEFITPITLSALTSKPVISEFFSNRDGSWNSHVDLGLWADAMVIAPATASSIGKMANGIADNMLITTYLSMKAPVFIAPAMDLDMYRHPSTQKNLATLKSYGNFIIEAADGELASHLIGKGRMQEPEIIFKEIESYFKQQSVTSNSDTNQLTGKEVMITAGPTHEHIDPVRYIGNYSSGKMGYALALECAQRGAHVNLISGPVNITLSNPNITLTNVETAEEMLEAAKSLFPQSDYTILCAAVADYKPLTALNEKIKREKTGEMLLKLVPTHDIASTLGKLKKEHQRTIGFALETNNEISNAIEKMKKKNLDFIVLNSLRNPNTCFGTDTNQVTIIHPDGTVNDYNFKTKTEVACDIINEMCEL